MEREVALEHRDRLTRITKDKDEFLAKLSVSRMSVYKVSDAFVARRKRNDLDRILCRLESCVNENLLSLSA